MKWLRRILKFGLIISLIGIIVAGGAYVAAYLYITPNLPDIDELRTVQLQVPLKVYSADGELLAEYGEKRRTPLTFAQLPKSMINAIVSAEDGDFWHHDGVDLRGLARAAVTLILTGQRRQGGSTITMQVARNFYLTRKKTYLRKLYEIFLALRIEKELPKQEILDLYLNKIYLGHRAYGVGAAARVYYGKPLDQLTLAETAMIAGLPKAPSAYNPLADPKRALERRNYVLGRMRDLGYITDAQYQTARAAPVTAKEYAPNVKVQAPYVAEMVRADMVQRYGEAAYTGGFKVYTTIRALNQRAANHALRTDLDDYTERHGYRGPEAKLTVPASNQQRDQLLANYRPVGKLLPALVLTIDGQTASAYLGKGKTITLDWKGLSWARPYISVNKRGPAPKQASDILAPGDLIRVRSDIDRTGKSYWRLAQVPKASGALVSLNPDDGAILALVGGYDYYTSKFNRVTQARRQPGSGFKPFVYSAALAKGFTAASVINDAPVVFNDPSLEGAWRPENYSGKFFGPTRLRIALKESRNLVSIRLLREVGVNYTVNYLAKFGFDPDKLPHNLSLALGSASVSPLQMARGYSVFANGGFLIDPYLIQRIEQNGQAVYVAQPKVACPQCDTDNQSQPSTAPAPDQGAARTAAATPDSGPAPTAGATPTAATVQVADAPNGVGAPNPGGAPTTSPLPLAPRVISPQNRYIMYSMMQDVIRSGTGIRARVIGRKDIAGKTGTTNEQRDAWFNGFNQSVVTNVWVGFDNNDRLGHSEEGSHAALPAWIDYMRTVLKGTPDDPPAMPPGMVTVRIDPKTGLRAPADLKDAIFEVFRQDHVPKQEPEPGQGINDNVPPTQDQGDGQPNGAAQIF